MTSAAAIPTVTLNDDNTMPVIGLGVGELSEAETEQAVSAALEAGYRMIDTAAAYGNEAAVGRAVAASGIARDELFITTKLATEDQGFQSSQDALRRSLERLGLDYVDLYLIHWPGGEHGKYIDSWGGLMRAKEDGHSRSIGVCNSHAQHLEDLIALSFFTPAVNQIELHPLLNQAELRAVNAENGITTEAYGPLGVGNLLFVWRLMPETAKPSGRVDLPNLAHEYRTLIRSPAFIGYAIGGGCVTTAMFAFVASAPFIFVEQLDKPASHVAYYLSLLILSISLGNFITNRTIQRVGLVRLMLSASFLSLAGGLSMLTVVLAGWTSVVTLEASMLLFTFGVGMTGPTALTLAVGVNPRVVGSAAGLYGFAQMGIGALCTGLAGLGDDPAQAAAVVLATAAVIGQIALRSALRFDRQVQR